MAAQWMIRVFYSFGVSVVLAGFAAALPLNLATLAELSERCAPAAHPHTLVAMYLLIDAF